MEIEWLGRYLHDILWVYRGCSEALGLANDRMTALLLAARSETVPRLGPVVLSDGSSWEYQVHGLGYSFRELAGSREIHFDIDAHTHSGTERIRVSIWKFWKYLSSCGETTTTEAEIDRTLRTLSERPGSLIRCGTEPLGRSFYFDEIVVRALRQSQHPHAVAGS